MKQSRWERLRQQVRDKDAEVTGLRAALAASERQVEMHQKRNRELLDDLLKVEFEARVAKGCYSSCPVGRIGDALEGWPR